MPAEIEGNDPFVRPTLATQRVITVLGHASLVWTIGYLLWRIGFTVGGADAPAGWVLFAAEALALAVFALRYRSARLDPEAAVVSPDAPNPDVAAVVDASGSTIHELRITLVSLRRVSGLDRIVVVDRTGSRWLESTAQRLGAEVHDSSRTFDDAVRSVGATWVLVLRSGDLPMPDLVAVCAPRCSAPDVGIIQVGVEEADPTSFEHDPDGRWSIDPFEQQVVRPSLARRGSMPFYGDGPALVRRSVMQGLASDGGHLLDDSWRVGLEARGRGFVTTQVPLTLARVRGPKGLGESLVRRHQRTRGVLIALRPRALRAVDIPTRLAHLGGLVHPVAAVQRVLLVVAATLVLGLAQVPIDAGGRSLLLLAVPSYLLRWTTHLLLGRRRLRPRSLLRSELRTLGVDLWPFGHPQVKAARASLGALVVAVIALVLAVGVAALSMWRDGSDRLPAGVAAVAFVLTVGFMGVAMEVLLDAIARRQRRSHHRVGLGLVTCRIQETDGQLVDLSTGGVGIVVAAEPSGGLEVGDVTTVAFRIPDADGAWKSVSTLVSVAHRSVESDGTLRFGLAFDDPTDAPLDPVIEFLTVDRRLVALGRHELANR